MSETLQLRLVARSEEAAKRGVQEWRDFYGPRLVVRRPARRGRQGDWIAYGVVTLPSIPVQAPKPRHTGLGLVDFANRLRVPVDVSLTSQIKQGEPLKIVSELASAIVQGTIGLDELDQHRSPIFEDDEWAAIKKRIKAEVKAHEKPKKRRSPAPARGKGSGKQLKRT